MWDCRDNGDGFLDAYGVHVAGDVHEHEIRHDDCHHVYDNGNNQLCDDSDNGYALHVHDGLRRRLGWLTSP